jgi:hypothetical protein
MHEFLPHRQNVAAVTCRLILSTTAIGRALAARAGIPDRICQHGVELVLGEFRGLTRALLADRLARRHDPVYRAGAGCHGCLSSRCLSSRCLSLRCMGLRCLRSLRRRHDLGAGGWRLAAALLAMRFNLALTALRLKPSRLAIWPALWPSVQSFLSSATSFASQLMRCLYTDCVFRASRCLRCQSERLVRASRA